MKDKDRRPYKDAEWPGTVTLYKELVETLNKADCNFYQAINATYNVLKDLTLRAYKCKRCAACRTEEASRRLLKDIVDSQDNYCERCVEEVKQYG